MKSKLQRELKLHPARELAGPDLAEQFVVLFDIRNGFLTIEEIIRVKPYPDRHPVFHSKILFHS